MFIVMSVALSSLSLTLSVIPLLCPFPKPSAHLTHFLEEYTAGEGEGRKKKERKTYWGEKEREGKKSCKIYWPARSNCRCKFKAPHSKETNTKMSASFPLSTCSFHAVIKNSTPPLLPPFNILIFWQGPDECSLAVSTGELMHFLHSMCPKKGVSCTTLSTVPLLTISSYIPTVLLLNLLLSY